MDPQAQEQQEIQREFDMGDLMHLEELFFDEGREEGVRDGLRSGRPEGYALGLEKGYEIQAEVGFYEGCVSAWRELMAIAAGPVPLPSSHSLGPSSLSTVASTRVSGSSMEDLGAITAPNGTTSTPTPPSRSTPRATTPFSPAYAQNVDAFLADLATFPVANQVDHDFARTMDNMRGRWKRTFTTLRVPAAAAQYADEGVWRPVAHGGAVAVGKEVPSF
ncbi:hypothetical protein BC828DRAFT_389040 [Blastocladiella britannica]|nr:hypothetical protein BC828DRAFT_389040 [Blastocladiella britannica]